MAFWEKSNTTPASSTKKNNRRFYVLIGILILAGLILIGRLVDLCVIDSKFLRNQGDARTLRINIIPATRGFILDRYGKPLAISTPVIAVWFNPVDFKPTLLQIKNLSHILNINSREILLKIKKNSDKEFVYLKRGLSLSTGKTLQKLKIPGLFLHEEYHRYYPDGEVFAPILGSTNVDDKGQEGLELAYNDELTGTSGIRKVVKDRLGHIIAAKGIIRAPSPGHVLNLSLDERIQYVAYQALQKGTKNISCDSATAIVLNVKTGEILAMANWPSYNPNQPRRLINSENYRNRAETDVLEPGSTIKTFSMGTVLSSKKYRPTSMVDTAPGWLIVDGKRIADEKNNGLIDLTTILKISSNVGMSKLILTLSPNALREMLEKLGFGEVTESNFPGERSGYLPYYRLWNPFVLSTLSFGYGLSATPLQLAQAYSVLANKGIKIPVTFLKLSGITPMGKRVMESQLAQELMGMLQAVLSQGGTAVAARVPGYLVAGKTGTTRVVGEHGYEQNIHNGIFVGIAPVSNPSLLVIVVIKHLNGNRLLAGPTAGPIFSQIMSTSLRLLNIPPDDLINLHQSSPPYYASLTPTLSTKVPLNKELRDV